MIVMVLLGACGGSDRSELMRDGRDLYTGYVCATCHGDRGQGGIGPALSSVTVTFVACADQVEWIRLGSEGWLREYGDRYGDTDRPLDGGMVAYENSLSDAELRTVAVYVRTEFGGLAEATARADCGI